MKPHCIKPISLSLESSEKPGSTVRIYWALVKFSVQNLHNFHETHGKCNSLFNFSKKHGLNTENLISAECFSHFEEIVFCCSI